MASGLDATIVVLSVAIILVFIIRPGAGPFIAKMVTMKVIKVVKVVFLGCALTRDSGFHVHQVVT